MDINIVIIDWMIAERELWLKMQEKNEAVKRQDFQQASKLLEEQREIEKRLPTVELLQEMKNKLQSKV